MVTNKNLLKNLPKKSQSGFGLVELMVSIGIIALVMGVIMVKQSAFNGATLLRDQAYVLALVAREVQLMAVSAERSSTDFRNVYGLHFDTSTPNNYFVFRDADTDYYYDSGENYGKQAKVDGRFSVDAIRLIGGGTTNNVSITFERPNFDAKIYTSSGAVASGVSGVEIDIRVKGTTGTGANKVRTLEITKVGQISVKDI